MDIDAKTAMDVAAFLPKALEVAKRVWAKVDNSVDNSIRKSHLNYACSVISKYSRAKTFLIRTESQYLYDFYVPSSIHKRGVSRISQVNLSKLKNIDARLIVTGGGGSGKTVLMRHLLLDALAVADNFPVLVELRNLNDDSQKTLEQEIFDVLARHQFDLPVNYIRESLKSGLFVLLLDGYDEVQHSRRKSLEREIRRLADSCACQIVITSRNDSALESWDRFSNVEISPLTLDEACELVEKVHFDEEIKVSFGKKLKQGLFDSHQFFLSNPLLLSIMLLTYGDSADIPKKLSTFYLQAYEALFHGHDALKSSFKRDRKTDLDIYEFARIFSGFCILSYDKRAFNFSKTDAVKYVRSASDLTGISRFEPQGFVDDARQAVCLLVEDGLELSFSHRSFQEFFAAKFISESAPELQKIRMTA